MLEDLTDSPLILTANGVERMWIDTAGNVAIGTTASQGD
jgi:hypothetical protein